MSTETTNKKIKIDNGTTFGRTYTDKAVDELLKNVDSVFDITPYLTSNTSISVEGYNALREFVTSNKGSISKVLIGSDYFYYTLCQLNENGMLFTKVGGESHESGDTVVISLMVTSDGSCTFISDTYTPVKANASNPTSILRTIGIGGSVYSIPTGKGLNILNLNLKDCMNESDYNELFGYILQRTVIAKTYNITLPDLTDVDIVKFTVETPDGNMNTTFYRNSKAISQFNWLCNWTDDENFIQMVTITGNTDNNVKYIKYNGIDSSGDIWLDITPYLNEDMTAISQEGYDLVYNAFSIDTATPNNKYVGILLAEMKMFYNEFVTSDKTGLNFISDSFENGVKRSMSVIIYDDKSIEIINRVISPSNKIWYDLYLTPGATTITQEQYNEIKKLIDSNSLAGITPKRISDGYFSLIMSFNGTFTFRYLDLSNESNTGDKKYTIFKHEIIIKPDLSVSSSSEYKYIPLLTQSLHNQAIISIKTDGCQEDLTIGDGLAIENGVLKSTSKVLEKSITDILTNQEKISTIFNAMASAPTSRTHTAISLDNFIPLSEFQNCDKIILDLSSLSSLGISGQLVFTKGFNTGSHGRAFYLTYMVGTVTSFSIANVVLATGSDGTALIRLVVEQSGTTTPLIDTDLANYYTKTEVDSTIQSTIGDINSILDNINGEVI